ncbi:hypothetical protein [Phaeospirillum tilakii]|uniref:Uncharacterized protein n=1 Tax=Phaeospirillum tilakii TaxID=741673 RepID=A0ABW5CEK4_9PROT
MAITLNIRRQPYEEPNHTQLFITVSNGLFAGSLDIYCNVEDIAAIGRNLKAFPTKAGDEYLYQYGSEAPEMRWYRHFVFRAYTVGSLGQCAVQIIMNRNETGVNDAACRFSFPVEAGALNRLGRLLERFGALEHLELEWSPSAGRLYETHQQPITPPWIPAC